MVFRILVNKTISSPSKSFYVVTFILLVLCLQVGTIYLHALLFTNCKKPVCFVFPSLTWKIKPAFKTKITVCRTLGAVFSMQVNSNTSKRVLKSVIVTYWFYLFHVILTAYPDLEKDQSFSHPWVVFIKGRWASQDSLAGLVSLQRGSGFPHWIVRDREVESSLRSGHEDNLFSCFLRQPAQTGYWEGDLQVLQEEQEACERAASTSRPWHPATRPAVCSRSSLGSSGNAVARGKPRPRGWGPRLSPRAIHLWTLICLLQNDQPCNSLGVHFLHTNLLPTPRPALRTTCLVKRPRRQQKAQFPPWNCFQTWETLLHPRCL